MDDMTKSVLLRKDEHRVEQSLHGVLGLNEGGKLERNEVSVESS